MKHSLRRYLKLSLALGMSLFASSCLQTELTVNLNKDGSGTIVEQTILGAQMLEMMGQFQQPGQPDPIKEMFSEEKAKAKIGKMGEGVEFVKVEMINEGGKKGGRVHYKFADINKVNLNPAGGLEAMNEGGEAEVKPEDLVKFKYADGKLTLLSPPADFEEMNMAGGGEEAENPEMKAMAKQMMADMRITMKVTCPGGIEKTNASYVDGNTVTVMDVQMGKILDQEAAMKKIAETAKTDKEAAKAEFKKLDGIKVETTEEVTVSLK